MRFSHPHQHSAILVDRKVVDLNQFLFEGGERLLIKMKLSVSVQDTRPRRWSIAVAWSRISSKVIAHLPLPMRRTEDGVDMGQAVRAHLYAQSCQKKEVLGECDAMLMDKGAWTTDAWADGNRPRPTENAGVHHDPQQTRRQTTRQSQTASLRAQERLERDRRQAQQAAEALEQALHDLGLPANLVVEIEGRLRSQQKLLGKIVGVMSALFGCRTNTELCRVRGWDKNLLTLAYALPNAPGSRGSAAWGWRC